MNLQTLQPIVFINGDGGTGRVAPLVRKLIFGAFPTVDIPMTVEDRLNSNDECIDEAVEAIIEIGAAFKNSTRSSDQRLVKRKMKSGNIVMRPKLGAYAMLRMLNAARTYDEVCGILRYAYGGIYSEDLCEELIDEETGDHIAVYRQTLNLTKLRPFAQLAVKIAREQELDLRLTSKYTIADSEKLFKEHIEDVLREENVKWTHHLTDIGLAILPVKTANGGSGSGGFLHIADNANGDTASDIVDHQNGDFVMGSEIFCLKNDKRFSYHELPGGTAEQMLTGELVGDNFLNPSSIIFALCGAFESVNPDQKEFFDAVRQETIAFLDTGEKDTMKMIETIAANCSIGEGQLT